MDYCTDYCGGCIVIPYDRSLAWTCKAMNSIQLFLLKNGFVIRDMISNMHRYHLKDNPGLRSATIIVDRIDKVESKYKGVYLPKDTCIHLYGSPRKIPRYIMDTDETYGEPDYNWEYGII